MLPPPPPPCRVYQLSEQELLCQAARALMKVTRCKTDYEPFILNLQSLHGKMVSRTRSLPPRCPAAQLRPPRQPCPPQAGFTEHGPRFSAGSPDVPPGLIKPVFVIWALQTCAVLQDNLSPREEGECPRQPPPPRTSGHGGGGHTAGHRGWVLVLSNRQIPTLLGQDSRL